jgi:DNA-directed RNA polymerase subunit RPC12/RpoP
MVDMEFECLECSNNFTMESEEVLDAINSNIPIECPQCGTKHKAKVQLLPMN